MQDQEMTYLLFIGDEYYPAGGAHDLVGHFDNTFRAMNALADWVIKDPMDLMQTTFPIGKHIDGPIFTAPKNEKCGGILLRMRGRHISSQKSRRRRGRSGWINAQMI